MGCISLMDPAVDEMVIVGAVTVFPEKKLEGLGVVLEKLEEGVLEN